MEVVNSLTFFEFKAVPRTPYSRSVIKGKEFQICSCIVSNFEKKGIYSIYSRYSSLISFSIVVSHSRSRRTIVLVRRLGT
jgi:hypothetical protein